MPMPAFENRDPDDFSPELLVSGCIYPDCVGDATVEVERDMIILTSDGREAGRVAAVLVNRTDRNATHIILNCGIGPPEYRLVPIALIERVQEGKVLLHIVYQTVAGLAKWQGS